MHGHNRHADALYPESQPLRLPGLLSDRPQTVLHESSDECEEHEPSVLATPDVRDPVRGKHKTDHAQRDEKLQCQPSEVCIDKMLRLESLRHEIGRAHV